MKKLNPGLGLIAALALVQAIAGVVRSLNWFDIGSDLIGQGLLLMPMVGLLAIGRGMFVGALALLFLVFSIGLWLQRNWARWLGLILASVNLLLVASLLAQGETLPRAAVWMIVPVAMLGYLLSPAGRRALN